MRQPAARTPDCLTPLSGWSGNFEPGWVSGGGWVGDGVVIYRKWTQWTIFTRFIRGKMWLTEKYSVANWGNTPAAPPLWIRHWRPSFGHVFRRRCRRRPERLLCSFVDQLLLHTAASHQHSAPFIDNLVSSRLQHRKTDSCESNAWPPVRCFFRFFFIADCTNK